MAGSYSHIEHGWSLVENMGDAAETAEELLWLVWYFARVAAKVESLPEVDATIRAVLDGVYYPMCRGEQPKDDLFLEVEQRMEK